MKSTCAGDSVRKAGKIFDLLDADQMAAGDVAFQHQRGKAVARGEQSRGQSSEPGAHNYNVIICHSVFSLPCTFA